MHLSTKGRYAVMAMVDLARSAARGGARAVSLAEIAGRQEISLAYLEQIFARLRRGGLVIGARGPGGGYVLSRPAAEIPVFAVIAAVDEPVEATRCRDGSGCLAKGERCMTHGLWDALGRSIERFLSDVTLADVVEGRFDASARGRGRRMSRLAPVYLDHAATSPVRPQAAEAVAHAMTLGGNASSVHAAGRAARDLIERARADVAAAFGADPERLIFTSGGVEADNLAITSAVAHGARRLIVGATEHPAVAVAARATGLPVEAAPVTGEGVADLGWLADRLSRWNGADGRPFVALMLANNETGVLHPIAEAAVLVRDAGGWLHVDAVAAAGKIAVDMGALGADTLAVSGHKLGGPQGSGALAWSECVEPVRALHGGGHERGFRSGTENTPGIAGFAAAARAAIEGLSHAASQAPWRDAAAAKLKAAGVRVAGEGAARTPTTLSIAAPDFASHLQVMALDLEGVMVSGGSACASGKVKPSGVLEAMGFGPLASGSLRASGGWSTTEADWARFADAWITVHTRAVSRARTPEYT